MAQRINGGTIRYGIEYQVNSEGLKKVQKDLRSLMNLETSQVPNPLGKSMEVVDKELKVAQKDAQKLMDILNRSTNNNLGGFNITKFNQELKKVDLAAMRQNLSKVGATGKSAFDSMINQSLAFSKTVKTNNGLLDTMAKSIMTSARIGISTAIFQGFTSTITNAISYVEKLDSSLNDIRIVTKKSSDEMANFAVQANAAAQKLGISTRDYAQGALTYYQQGLEGEDVQKRSEITAKVANVTNQSLAQSAEQVTAISNAFRLSAEEIEPAMDKVAKVAAVSASDFAEVSSAFQKVAATASTTGTSVGSLAAQLGTVIDVTREAPETVGTAFKTIYARIADLKIGNEDEFGVTLGDVSGQLAKVGINILDANGQLKDMDNIITDLGTKWQTWGREQQQAVAIAVAGKRQYVQLEALLNNWDKYQGILHEVNNAQGELQAQQDIYMDRAQAHIQQMNTAWESVQGELLDSDSIKIYADTMRDIANTIASIIKSLGGGKAIFPLIAGILTQLMSKQLSQGIVGLTNGIKAQFEVVKNRKAQAEIAGQLSNIGIGENATAYDKQIKQLWNIQSQNLANPGLLTEKQSQQLSELSDGYVTALQQINEHEEERKDAIARYNEIVRQEGEKIQTAPGLLNDAQRNKIVIKLNEQKEFLNKIEQQALDFGDTSQTNLIVNNLQERYDKTQQIITKIQAQKTQLEQTVYGKQDTTLTERNIAIKNAQRAVNATPISDSQTLKINQQRLELLRQTMREINDLDKVIAANTKKIQQYESELNKYTQNNYKVISQEQQKAIGDIKTALYNALRGTAEKQLSNEMKKEIAEIQKSLKFKVSYSIQGDAKNGIPKLDFIDDVTAQRLQTSLSAAKEALNQAGMSTETLDRLILKLGNDADREFQEVTENADKTGAALRRLGEEARKVDIVNTVVSGISGFANVAMAINQIRSALQSLGDESLTTEEKMTRLLTVFAFNLPMVMSNIRQMQSAYGNLMLVIRANTAALSAETAAEGANTISKKANIVNTLAHIASNTAHRAATLSEAMAMDKETVSEEINNVVKKEGILATLSAAIATDGLTGAITVLRAAIDPLGAAITLIIGGLIAWGATSSWLAEEERKRIEKLNENQDKQSQKTKELIENRKQEITQLDSLIEKYTESEKVIGDLSSSEEDILQARKDLINISKEYHLLMGEQISDVDLLTASNENLLQSLRDLQLQREEEREKAARENIESISRTSKETIGDRSGKTQVFSDIEGIEREGGGGLTDTRYQTYTALSKIAPLTLKRKNFDGGTEDWYFALASFTDEELNPENIATTVQEATQQIEQIQDLVDEWTDVGNTAQADIGKKIIEALKKRLTDAGLTEERIKELQESVTEEQQAALNAFTIEHQEVEQAQQDFLKAELDSDTPMEDLVKIYSDYVDKNTAAKVALKAKLDNSEISQDIYDFIVKKYEQDENNYLDFYKKLQNDKTFTIKVEIGEEEQEIEIAEETRNKIREYLKDKSPEDVKEWYSIFLEQLKVNGPDTAYANAIKEFAEKAREKARKSIKPAAAIEFFGLTDTDKNPFEGWIRGAEDYFKILKKITSISTELSDKINELYSKGFLSTDALEYIASQITDSDQLNSFLGAFEIREDGNWYLKSGYNADNVLNPVINDIRENSQKQLEAVTNTTLGGVENFLDEIHKGYGTQLDSMIEKMTLSDFGGDVAAFAIRQGVKREMTEEELNRLSNYARENNYVDIADALDSFLNTLTLNKNTRAIGEKTLGALNLNFLKKTKTSNKSLINTKYPNPFKDTIDFYEGEAKNAEKRYKQITEDFSEAVAANDLKTARKLGQKRIEAYKALQEVEKRNLGYFQEVQATARNNLISRGVNANEIDTIGASAAAQKKIESNQEKIDSIREGADGRELTRTENDTIANLTLENSILEANADSYDEVTSNIENINNAQSENLKLLNDIKDTWSQIENQISKAYKAAAEVAENTDFDYIVHFNVETESFDNLKLTDEQKKKFLSVFDEIDTNSLNYDNIIKSLVNSIVNGEDIDLAQLGFDAEAQERLKALADETGISLIDWLLNALPSELQDNVATLSAKLKNIQNLDENTPEEVREEAQKEYDSAKGASRRESQELELKRLEDRQKEYENDIALEESKLALLDETDYENRTKNYDKRLDSLRSQYQINQETIKYLQDLIAKTDDPEEKKKYQEQLNEALNKELDLSKQILDIEKEKVEEAKKLYDARVEGYNAAREVLENYLDSSTKGLEEEIDAEEREIAIKEHNLALLEDEIDLQQKEIDKTKEQIEKQKKLLNKRKELLQALLKEYQERWALEDRDRERQEQRENRAEKVAERAKTMVAASQGDLEALSRVEDLDEEIEEIDKELLESLIQDVRDAITNGIEKAIEAIENQEKALDDSLEKQQEALDALNDKLDPLREEIEAMQKALEFGPKWALQLEQWKIDDFKKSDDFQKALFSLLANGFAVIGGQSVSAEDLMQFTAQANRETNNPEIIQKNADLINAMKKGGAIDQKTFQSAVQKINEGTPSFVYDENGNIVKDEKGNPVIDRKNGNNIGNFDASQFYTIGSNSSSTSLTPISLDGYLKTSSNYTPTKATDTNNSAYSPEKTKRVRTYNRKGKKIDDKWMTQSDWEEHLKEQSNFRFKSAAGVVSGIPAADLTQTYHDALEEGAKKFADNTIMSQMWRNADTTQTAPKEEEPVTTDSLVEAFQPEEFNKNLMDMVETLKGQYDIVSSIKNSLDTIAAIEPRLEISVGNMLNVEGDMTKEVTDAAFRVAGTALDSITAMGKALSRKGVV